MAGVMSNIAKNKNIKNEKLNLEKFSAEGVEGYIPYSGGLEQVITKFTQGIQSGMSYVGARTLPEL